MTFLVWHAAGDARIASPRLVLRAGEVPQLQQALQLRDRLALLLREGDQRIAAATREAIAQGHAQGLAEGRQASRDDIAGTLASLAQEAAQERDRLRGEIGALALQVVRKVVGGVADDALLAALAATAARDALPAPQLTLVVHADLADAVRERLVSFDSALRIDVRGDAECPRETCRLDSEHGSIDASLDAQLARLEQAWEAA